MPNDAGPRAKRCGATCAMPLCSARIAMICLTYLWTQGSLPRYVTREKPTLQRSRREAYRLRRPALSPPVEEAAPSKSLPSSATRGAHISPKQPRGSQRTLEAGFMPANGCPTKLQVARGQRCRPQLKKRLCAVGPVNPGLHPLAVATTTTNKSTTTTTWPQI